MQNGSADAELASRPLAGKTALVSGSSSGIGATIARELSARGANIVINYPRPKDRDSALKVQQSLSAGTTSILVEADLSTLSGPSALASAAAQRFGKIDILVNNAGISATSDIHNLEEEEEIAGLWELIVNVNGRGTLLLTKACLQYIASTHSRIINICSTTSRNPDPNLTIYAGSKGMIESFTRCWAREFPRKYGCTVNAVAPGPIATESLLSAPPEFHKMIEGKLTETPVSSRLGRPEEVAWTVAMLCEEKAGWLNGLYLLVDGGSTLC